MVWLEVESKIKLKDSQVAALRKKIKEIAKFKKKGQKADDYFAIKQKGYPKKAFRFRTMKDGVEVTFKKHLKKYWTKYVVVKKEFEFTLDKKEDRESLMELFEDFNFEEWVRKVKRNETYTHKKTKGLSIEINFVKHLGYFIEMEFLCQKKDIKKGIKAIMDTIEELGIDLRQVNNVGYTKMLWKKHTLDKRDFIDQ